MSYDTTRHTLHDNGNDFVIKNSMHEQTQTKQQHDEHLRETIVAGLAHAHEYLVKDSGQRETYPGGMVRDTAEGKTNWALVADGPMLFRWATHLTKGALKYAKRNWMLASGDAEYDRAKESAFRHFMQWYRGDRDEDHAAAVFFNINEVEYIRENNQQNNQQPVKGESV